MSIKYFKDLLPNGLRLVTVETPHLHSAMVSVYVRVGSRHETRANNGVSHALEHLFFRGSARYPDTVAMNARVESVGGNLNGITSRDLSYYFTPAHPDGVGVALDVLGDLLTRPTLTRLELEKEIILEEMLDEVDEHGRDVDVENLSKSQRFGDHPLGLKIAGTLKSVRALKLSQVKDHYRKHYVAGNMVVAVAGKVSRAAMIKQATKAFAHVKSGTAVSEDPPPPPPKGPRLDFVRDEQSQTSFRLSFPTVPEVHRDFHALSALRRVLDDGLSSRLPFNVVEKRGLAYSVGATIEAFHDAGSFEIDGAAAPAKVADTVREILRTVDTLRAGKISLEEMRRARVRYRMAVESQQDFPGDLLGWFAGEELFRPPKSFATRCREVEGLKIADLVRVAKLYFRPERLLVVAVGPKECERSLRRAVTAWG
ncbi:MAG: family peptidase [Myxococcaceae bacterium]|nr:family peptidase [Myxococcaceae bacterium]